MKQQKGIAPILLIIIITATVGVFGILVAGQITRQSLQPQVCTEEAKQCPDGSYVGRTGPNCEFAQCPLISPIACTQEAMQCPNGSYVGRSGPNCEFAKCPAENPGGKQIILKEGQREASLLVQKIYSDYITGLNYPEYPIVTNQGYPITLRIGETTSNGCTITLTLVSIQNNNATFIEKTDFNRLCPICLAESTLIDTPNGSIPVQELKIGTPVWTVDELGNKISATITKISKTPVPFTHQMVHIILDDGRKIFASPGHPITDGRIFNNLSVGDIIDGSHVISAEKTVYNKDYTYDILPSGKTGFYFANGILIDSTLH